MPKIMMWVLWPSFLVAVAAVGVFFSIFSPADLPWLGRPRELSPQAVHTIGFFFFWALGALSSAFTLFLTRDGRKSSPL